MSPVLLRRKEAAAAASTPIPAAAAPVFHLNVGSELVNMLRPAGPAAAPMALSSSLLHASHCPGNNMSINDFCELYNLGGAVLGKFTENKFTRARMLRFVHIEELKEMGFKIGDIAGMKDVVETWSILAD
jgi:hypothetical protein